MNKRFKGVMLTVFSMNYSQNYLAVEVDVLHAV